MARWATAELRPHLTIVLDIDPAIGHTRFEGADRMEAEPLEFHQRVRQHFLDLAAVDPAHYLVVDGGRTPAEIHHDIRVAVEPWLVQAVAP